MNLLSFNITITSSKRALMTDVHPSTSFLTVLDLYVAMIREKNTAFELGAAPTAYQVVVTTTNNRALSCTNINQSLDKFMSDNSFVYGETIKALNFQLNPVGNVNASI